MLSKNIHNKAFLFKVNKKVKNFSSFDFVNPDLLKLKKSPTLAANEMQASVKSKKYKFGFGQSPFPIHQSVVRKTQENSFNQDYAPSSGISSLQDAIADWLLEYTGKKFDPRNIIIGPGTKIMLYLIQLSYNGETIIPAPSWVTYKPQAQILKKDIQVLQTQIQDRWFISPKHVEEMYSNSKANKLIIMNSPSNPTGQVLKDIEIKELSEGLERYRNNIVLSDEIYSLYSYKNYLQRDNKLKRANASTSFSKYYHDNTIITNGISKWGNSGGYRIGFAAFPDSLKEFVPVMTNLASETYSSATTCCQIAAIECFRNSINDEEFIDYIGKCTRIIEYVGKYVSKRLREMGGQCLDPEGGFYVFPDFSSLRETFKKIDIHDSTKLTQILDSQFGVKVLPGSSFCKPNDSLTFRLAFTDFDSLKALELIKYEEPNEEWLNICLENIRQGLDAIERLIKTAKSI